MDFLLRPDRLIRICSKLDSSGIIERFIHVPDKGELYDFAPHINISEENDDVTMYHVRVGYDLRKFNKRHNMNRYTMAILVTENGVEINITFTPNHFDEFFHRLKKQYKKVQKKCLTCEDVGTEVPKEYDELYQLLREYRFHARQMMNYFWNNQLQFYFDKQKIITNSNV